MGANNRTTTGADLSEVERQIVRALAIIRLATAAQLTSIVTVAVRDCTSQSEARAIRRRLARLTETRVLARLDRRIGGVDAGSTSYVYYLGPVGQRLVGHWKGADTKPTRRRPGARFIRHRLAVSELYVEAHRMHRSQRLDLVSFDAEPTCWHPFVDRLGTARVLRPDARLVRRAGGRAEGVFFEIDLGTETRRVVAKKLGVYAEYFSSVGSGAAASRVALLTTGERRRASLMAVWTDAPPAIRCRVAVGSLHGGLADVLAAFPQAAPRLAA